MGDMQKMQETVVCLDFGEKFVRIGSAPADTTFVVESCIEVSQELEKGERVAHDGRVRVFKVLKDDSILEVTAPAPEGGEEKKKKKKKNKFLVCVMDMRAAASGGGSNSDWNRVVLVDAPDVRIPTSFDFAFLPKSSVDEVLAGIEDNGARKKLTRIHESHESFVRQALLAPMAASAPKGATVVAVYIHDENQSLYADKLEKLGDVAERLCDIGIDDV